MIIRDADLDRDMPAIIKGAHEFAERAMRWVRLPDDDSLLHDTIARVAALEGAEILLAEQDGLVVGGIAMLYAPYLWNPERVVAEELFWFAFRDAPIGAGSMLLKEVMMRVRERRAIPMFKALITSPPGVAEAYRRYGLKPVETVFTEAP